MVINFIEHISMAHPLCHALFTQLELGIKRYTYWAGGQKYFYSPELLASTCRTWELCVQWLQGECDWPGVQDLAKCRVTAQWLKINLRAGQVGTECHHKSPGWTGQVLHWWLSPSKHIFRCCPGTWELKALGTVPG